MNALTCEFYCPEDMQVCGEARGAACGHGALAAVLEVPVAVACVYFSSDLNAGVRWVNMPMMERALRMAGCRWLVKGRCDHVWPARGLVLIQWTGPWMEPGVPMGARCQHRHWVACRNGWVWDANLEMWVGRSVWEQWAEDELRPKRADGWTVARGYEVTLPARPYGKDEGRVE